MVSIVELEIVGFLSFSNWPGFDQKWSKIGHFGPQMAQVFKHRCSKKIFGKNFENFENFFYLFFFFKIEKKLFRAKKIHIFPL